jgi:ABC-type molybdate transport system ATPase subunit
MNKVVATVQNIEETDIVTYIHVNNGESAMYLIKSQKPNWLSVGDKVYCNFQEGSVCLSKDCPGKVSIENTLPVTLANIRKNGSLCELTLNNSDFGDIVSLITASAYEKLDLQEGCKATMLLRGIDIKLEPFFEHFKASSF